MAMKSKSELSRWFTSCDVVVCDTCVDSAGIPIVQLVAGCRVSTSTDEGFALALSDSGDVYSWGKGYKGRLGHVSTENVRSPKMVDALGGKDIKMVTYCPLFLSLSLSLSLSHTHTHIYSSSCSNTYVHTIPPRFPAVTIMLLLSLRQAISIRLAPRRMANSVTVEMCPLDLQEM